MRTPRRREPNQIGPLSIVALAATLLVLVAASGPVAGSERVRVAAATWRGLVGEQRPEVAVGERLLVVLKAPSLADRVAAAGGQASDLQERRWTQQAQQAQKDLFDRLALQGIAIKPEYTYTRVLNGFAAAVDPRAVPVLERAPEVLGLYPVRAAYPAAVSTSLGRGLFGPGSGHRTDVTLPGFDGRGVVIALLDSGVDRSHPFVRGRVRPGIDVLAGDRSALAEAHPENSNLLETHGTAMAGLLAGSGGPGGLAGVAPGATILPIRVAGWQRVATGQWAVYARSDQIVAGLEKAVDPNGDGVAHDAARIALVPLSEPYAAFPASPTARAVAGAFRLDTLVVVAAGNDGPAGPSYGSISGPGGSPSALTVGAADVRRETDEVRVVLRAGLQVAYAGVVPLVGAVAPRELTTLEPGAPGEHRGRPLGPDEPAPLREYFDEAGFSLVAGRAAIVDGGAQPAEAVRRAATAGAAAVLVYGSRLPAGGLGLDEEIGVPVVGIPDGAAHALLDALAERSDAAVTIGTRRVEPNAGADRVAAFSSRGLAFDGRVKPDLIGPGVALATSAAGANDDGSPRYGTVNGSSASAATIAGAAALLAQARPSLGASALRSLLVGTARPFERESVLAQGAGLVDLGAAVAAEFAVDDTTLSFGHVWSRGALRERTITLHNLSPRELRIGFSSTRNGDGVDVAVRPRSLRLPSGGTGEMHLRLTLPRDGAGVAEGVLLLRPQAGRELRVPWAAVLSKPPDRLVADVQLSAERFKPSDGAPSVLSMQAGRVSEEGGKELVYPVSRLDIELWSTGDERTRIGTLARLRDLLPGRYAFGLTGRGPAGELLRPGRYRVEVVGWPTEPGPPTRESAWFAIAR